MSRVPIYPPGRKRAATSQDAALPAPAGGPQPSGYFEKLVKYVPAEVVAAYTAIAAIVPDDQIVAHVVVFVGFGIATPLVMWVTSPAEQRPPWFFLGLSCVSFGAWSLATSELAVILRCESWIPEAVLASAAFAIPLVDAVATRLLRPR